MTHAGTKKECNLTHQTSHIFIYCFTIITLGTVSIFHVLWDNTKSPYIPSHSFTPFKWSGVCHDRFLDVRWEDGVRWELDQFWWKSRRNKRTCIVCIPDIIIKFDYRLFSWNEPPYIRLLQTDWAEWMTWRWSLWDSWTNWTSAAGYKNCFNKEN